MDLETRSPSPAVCFETHLRSIITQASNTTLNTNYTANPSPTSTSQPPSAFSRRSSRDELTELHTTHIPLEKRPSTRATNRHRRVSSVSSRPNWRWSTISRDTGHSTTNRSRWSTSTHGGNDNRASMAITALPSLLFSPVPNLGLTPIPLPPKEPSIYDDNTDGLARNWTAGKKWRTTLFVAWLAFISPLASSMVAPAVTLVRDEFKYDGDDWDTFIVSAFIFGYVVC